MSQAYVFPGQGAQFGGMGKALYQQSPEARELFERANSLLGFRITDVMFDGSDEDVLRTDIAQPAVFLHSVIAALTSSHEAPSMVAGHSLGEFSALVVAGVLSFEDGLLLVKTRAEAMQQACEATRGTMAAVVRLADEVVEQICAPIDGVVVANYNCPGQVVISGTLSAVNEACAQLKAAGPRVRTLPLSVAGAFHSPLMQPAAEQLQQAIEATTFHPASCPVYQNVDAMPHTSPEDIRRNLLLQLTSSVRFTATIHRMVADGCTSFLEFGPGTVLQGLISKTEPSVQVASLG